MTLTETAIERFVGAATAVVGVSSRRGVLVVLVAAQTSWMVAVKDLRRVVSLLHRSSTFAAKELADRPHKGGGDGTRQHSTHTSGVLE